MSHSGSVSHITISQKASLFLIPVQKNEHLQDAGFGGRGRGKEEYEELQLTVQNPSKSFA